MHRSFSLIVYLMAVASCSSIEEPQEEAFNNPTEIKIEGYSNHAMEPFISPDGQTLFFNNWNLDQEDANIHYATKLSEASFKYEGLVGGVNTEFLEGVPNLDEQGRFYYTGVETYFDNHQTIYEGDYSEGNVSNAELIDEMLTLNIPGWLNMDAGVSPNGNEMYLAIARFTGESFPVESNLILATRENGVFIKHPDSEELLGNINTPDLEYAACISYDGLTLYFNRTVVSRNPFSFKIMKATRTNNSLRFGVPEEISVINGFVEGASISSDNKTLYYHVNDDGLFKIYKVTR